MFVVSSWVGREPRLIETPGRVVEITARTMHGRYLLRPSEEVNELILGVMGRAQAKYDMVLFAFVFMSNHVHLLAQPRSVKQMSLFTGYVLGNVAREVGVVHQWRQKFWARRYDHAPVKDIEAVQIKRFRYLLRNGCKEDLVASPLDWPGVSSARALYDGHGELTGRWFDRTAAYRARRPRGDREFSSLETVRLSPMPFLADRSVADQQQFVIDAVHQVEEETAERHRANGSRPVGARLVMSQRPHSSPRNFTPSPAPRFHASTRGEYQELLEARRNKVAVYRAAAERLKAGERDVEFPPDCFPPGLPFVEPEPT